MNRNEKMNKYKKALVTGGLGFIGSNLVNQLVKNNWEVFVVDDMSGGHLDFSNKKARVFICDFADTKILNLVKAGTFDIIFHEAAVPRVSYSVENPSETTDTNISKTVKLMEAAIGKIDRFVFASSSSVYGGADSMPTSESEQKRPVSPYALQKGVIEDYCKLFNKLYGFDSVCLRYFNVFGPNQYGDSPYSTAISAWCDAIKNDKRLRSDGDGKQSRDLCYVDNVVSANIIVATAAEKFEGKCFNVGCGDRTTNNEILDYFKSRYPEAQIVRAPERAGDVKHTQADISELVKLGYKAKVNFWNGLEKTLDWWQI